MPDARRKPRPAIIDGDIAYIPLGVDAQYGYAIVDSDLSYLADEYKWTLDSSKRYAVTGTLEHRGKRLALAYLHRVVVGLDTEGMIDHISRDKLDNRRANLRVADNRINQINTAPRGGTSKYRGVFWDKRCNLWRSQIKDHGKTYYLGYYDDERAAARVYNTAAVKHFGDYAVLNKIEESK